MCSSDLSARDGVCRRCREREFLFCRNRLQLLRDQIGGNPMQIKALAAGAIFPAARGVVEIVRRRRVDIIGTMVLAGIAASIIAAAVGGSPQLFLIRESFVTGALGVLALSSLH